MKLVKNREVLSMNYVPSKLPCRENEIKELTHKLKRPNYKTLILGGTGTGKTTYVEKSVLEQKNCKKIWVNCSEQSSFSSVMKKIIETITGKLYNERGKPRSIISNDLTKLLKTKRKYRLMFIFDEIDKLIDKDGNHSELLFIILNNIDATFILISNNFDALRKLDIRIKSRLSPEKKIIPFYNANDLYHILKQRVRLGLTKENIVDEEVLLQIAKYIAEISGDARTALRLFFQSISLAELENSNRITIDHLNKAKEEIKENEFDDIYLSLNKHLKTIIASIALNSRKNIEGYAITFPDVYETYVKIVSKSYQNQYGNDSKKSSIFATGQRNFENMLNILEEYGLIKLGYASAKNRRGRLRIAYPNFNVNEFLDNYT